MTTKRAYKLQEFVAHSSNVNCLKIGRKSSRVLLTGGEDHKVNLWAIGKPNSILSLSGHTSAVESVNFDSSEVLVAAGAASGTIKLWDLEEAKLIRTLTGHRSNCITVDFHPFGEFFASGSLDTNLKIWDIRRKGCIHTYKGHNRGVNTIRFTPDGRWVVSGGEDNVIKLWDLTAGKLLHDFKCHEGQIHCIDFHPHEFLLATGSADRTVKFWDLETFELIGSVGPETSGVRAMTFNPDGRTLLCGLHESLKVFSWEPIRCHDAVDVGWCRLSDFNIHEGKLLGCSYNQSCVGVWVVDISRIEPYSIKNTSRSSSGNTEPKYSSNGNVSEQMESSVKTSMGRLSLSQNSDPSSKEIKTMALSMPGTPQKIGLNAISKASAGSSGTVASIISSSTTPRRGSITARTQSINLQSSVKSSDVVPIIVPRSCAKEDQGGAEDPQKEMLMTGKTVSNSTHPRITDFRKLTSSCSDDLERANASGDVVSIGTCRSTDRNETADEDSTFALNCMNQMMTTVERNIEDIRGNPAGKYGTFTTLETANYDDEIYDSTVQKQNIDSHGGGISKGGRPQSLVASREKGERSPSSERPSNFNNSTDERISSAATVNSSVNLRGCPSPALREIASTGVEDAIPDLMEQHEQFLVSMESRLTKLQVVHGFWKCSDLKGVVEAMEKMSDHAVIADITGIWMEKSDNVTLDICSCLLPLLKKLLESNMDRHTGISLEMLGKLVKIFGPVIRLTLTASSHVGVDLQAEQRLERCNICFIELEKVKQLLPYLTRRGGSIGKSAQELKFALEEVL